MVLFDYWRSSASYRVRIALGLAGLEFEPVQVNLLECEHRSAAHRSRNPQGLVPALEIDGIVITQSLAIIEYLHETGRGEFLHGSPKIRAMTRAVAQAIAMEIHPVCNLSVARHAVDASDGSIAFESWMTTFIPRGLEAVEAMLGRFEDGIFCCGDRISIADICLVPQVYNAKRWGVDLSPYGLIREAVAAAEKLPQVRAAHPDNFKPNGVRT
ncbi:MAG: maleylacetoacetate isomerase [Albidovulum sp.]|nr:maleylacetoacetate isomerase [Albidovulum sp.]